MSSSSSGNLAAGWKDDELVTATVTQRSGSALSSVNPDREQEVGGGAEQGGETAE